MLQSPRSLKALKYNFNVTANDNVKLNTPIFTAISREKV